MRFNPKKKSLLRNLRSLSPEFISKKRSGVITHFPLEDTSRKLLTCILELLDKYKKVRILKLLTHFAKNTCMKKYFVEKKMLQLKQNYNYDELI